MTLPYEVEYLVAPNTIHVTFHPGYDHQCGLTDQIVDWLNQAKATTYIVLDITDLDIDCSTLVTELTETRWQDLRQTDFKALVVVVNDDALPQWEKAFSQLWYGGFQVAVFATLKEAMGYVGETYYEDEY